ncbi:motile sperm domain-containing protein 2 isoform X1 [Danio rerio]|uniref:Motile sperm domain-containing protein 2 isoform X1 n=1 Tax=Danio rerio TaxID=7955 RepID=A0AC58GDX3_DANRE
MAEAGQAESEQDIEIKIQETRQRFKSEYVEAQESQEKYDSRDVEKLFRDDALVEGYLTWRHFIVEDTLKMIDESLQWRREFSVNDLTESSIPRWMFEIGAVYLHGYDKEGNKLFWFKVKLHIKDPKTVLDKKRYVAFWLERYAKREPGMPLTVVFDMSESGLSNIDMDFVKYIISCFKVYYPKFLSKMIMYEMPWIMNAAWKIVKTWLGPDAISKLKFVSKSDIQTFVGPEHLPPYMGGTVNFIEDGQRSEELDRESVRLKGARKPTTTFKATLMHISPAEELSFGASESEKKCLIVLNNVTKNHVAFKVRTTAPEKYRVKPSNSSCEPGASVDIVVSLHGGFQASPQDRFLVMAAEMESSSGAAATDLAQFWKEVSKPKIMEHRLRCHVLESPKSILSNSFEFPSSPTTNVNEHQDLQSTLMRLLATNAALEQKLDWCLWTQKVLLLLLLFLLALSFTTAYTLWTS